MSLHDSRWKITRSSWNGNRHLQADSTPFPCGTGTRGPDASSAWIWCRFRGACRPRIGGIRRLVFSAFGRRGWIVWLVGKNPSTRTSFSEQAILTSTHSHHCFPNTVWTPMPSLHTRVCLPALYTWPLWLCGHQDTILSLGSQTLACSRIGARWHPHKCDT